MELAFSVIYMFNKKFFVKYQEKYQNAGTPDDAVAL